MTRPRIEPEATQWRLSLAGAEPGADLVGLGADLEPGTVLRGYREGLFPMYVGREELTDSEADGIDSQQPLLGWWSPDPRGILPLAQLRLTRSLRQSMRRFRITVDYDFPAVMAACASASRPGHWITDDFLGTYTTLHEYGWAHSVEVWSETDELVGGLYGIEVGGLFAGESMFHRQRDASKAALVALVHELSAVPHQDRLLDVQWQTDHLKSLGVQEVSRKKYAQLLHNALRIEPVFSQPHVVTFSR